MTPRVSVLLPVRNAAATVVRAIESVRLQSYASWELVVVDDGSSDATPRLVAECAAREPRVRVVTHPAMGIAAALNAGLAVVRGDYVARLDADDEALPGRLALQVAALEADPGLGLVSCRVAYGGDSRLRAGYALHVEWLNTLLDERDLAVNRFVEAPFAHPSVMFRRSLVARHGGYREGDFPEDYELWLRWFEAGVRMVKLPETLLVWHDLPDRLSRSDPRYRPEAFYRLKAGYLAHTLRRTAEGRSVWVCGAGRPTRKRAGFLEHHGVRIAGYTDIDPHKVGARLSDRPVVAPGDLPPASSAFVLGYVGNRGAREQIRSLLRAQDRVEGRDFFMVA